MWLKIGHFSSLNMSMAMQTSYKNAFFLGGPAPVKGRRKKAKKQETV